MWREGLADWQDAGAVAEVTARLPPPGPSLKPRNSAAHPIPLEDADAIARLYRRLVLLVGLQLLIGCLVRVPSEHSASPAAALLALTGVVMAIGLALAMVITTYKLAQHLGAGSPTLWALGMFVPCANVLVLLALSAKAQAWCRRYGIKVGLLGPTKESIEQLRRGSSV